MAENLNIQKILPLFRTSLKVKSVGQKKQSEHQKAFDRQLKEEEKEKRKEKWKAVDNQNIDPDNKTKNTSNDVTMHEHMWRAEKMKQIDILA